jgi:hypothetical protein
MVQTLIPGMEEPGWGDGRKGGDKVAASGC